MSDPLGEHVPAPGALTRADRRNAAAVRASRIAAASDDSFDSTVPVGRIRFEGGAFRVGDATIPVSDLCRPAALESQLLPALRMLVPLTAAEAVWACRFVLTYPEPAYRRFLYLLAGHLDASAPSVYPGVGRRASETVTVSFFTTSGPHGVDQLFPCSRRGLLDAVKAYTVQHGAPPTRMAMPPFLEAALARTVGEFGYPNPFADGGRPSPFFDCTVTYDAPEFALGHGPCP